MGSVAQLWPLEDNKQFMAYIHTHGQNINAQKIKNKEYVSNFLTDPKDPHQ